MENIIDNTEPTFEEKCEEIYRLRNAKKELEERLSNLEKSVKDELHAIGETDYRAGRFLVHIKTVAPSKVVDTAKLKANGLFEEYSKEKAGYESVLITESKD